MSNKDIIRFMKKKLLIIGILVSVLLAVLLVFKFIFPVDVYINRGAHMEPALKDGDKVLLENTKNYERGDLMAIKDLNDLNKYIIHRIIGLPNEVVQIKGGDVFINDIILNESYAQDKTYPERSITLSNNQYYVLGDYRSKSADSRLFGPIDRDLIIGKVNNIVK